jgi:hypothetical protein
MNTRIQTPYTVHEADVGVFHAWGDGLPVVGPTPRHQDVADGGGFRAGLKMAQVDAGGRVGDFSEWRLNSPSPVIPGEWVVELSSPLGTATSAGVQVASLLASGAPVIVVVRFRCRHTGLWRVYQFHDAVALPADAAEESQRMMRDIRFSAGWMEEFKSGTMPPLEPRMRGVIEWRHLGRTVRCWEYDPEADAWAEDPENLIVMEGEQVRHVGLDFSSGGMALSMLAAVSRDVELASIQASGTGWLDVGVFSVPSGSSGLTMEPGWVLETEGITEPLLLPPSGRHWEHPRVVFRVLGRTYATACAGVFAVPSLDSGTPDRPLDLPVRMGRLILYPDCAWVLDP